MLWRKAVFIILVIFCLSPFGSPRVAVVLGMALGLTLGKPFPQISDKTTELLLEAAIILLAFGTDLSSVYRGFRQAGLFAAGAMLAFLILVYVLGRVLRLNRSPVPFASAANLFGDDDEGTRYPKPVTAAIMVSAIGMIVFPLIGGYFLPNPDKFGIWTAMSIPGAAFVAGSGATFKLDAAATAIPLALTATLVIGVVALIVCQIDHKPRTLVNFPWFVLLFLMAVAVRTYAPVSIFPSLFDSIVNLGNAGIAVGLFFIGAGISQSDIKISNLKGIIQVLVPWLLVSAASFWAVLHLL